MGKLKVVELFAGVGGFRLGLEGYNGLSASSNYEEPLHSSYKVIWSNQYEPLTPSKQHASWVYENRWPKAKHCREDIEKVIESHFDSIPDHDLLVGGFPCQDYSVATTLRNSKGLVGKKGVLWWSIYNIIQRKGKNKPNYLFLENVDRLLSSPVSQRGRDFAVMLSCLYEQGYAVEWRIINAADYGMPQRRRRIYIVAYHKNSPIYKKLSKYSKKELIEKSGIISSAFPVSLNEDFKEIRISKDFDLESKNFNKNGRLSPFRNSGYMKDGKVVTVRSTSKYDGDPYKLIDALEPLAEIDEFYVDKDKPVKRLVIDEIDGSEKIIEPVWDKWKYLKGPKNQYKYNKAQGYKYKYSEGKMELLDSLDKPSRSIVTREGGTSPSRFKHLVLDPITNKERRLRPVELETLNMFPKNHTKHEGVTDIKRAFFMGNALVVGVVEKIGKILSVKN